MPVQQSGQDLHSLQARAATSAVAEGAGRQLRGTGSGATVGLMLDSATPSSGVSSRLTVFHGASDRAEPEVLGAGATCLPRSAEGAEGALSLAPTCTRPSDQECILKNEISSINN